jgi:hypothetical protein
MPEPYMTHMERSLRGLQGLADGWDGRGSAKPTAASIGTACYMTAVPGGDGSVQLEMHAGGADIEIEIGPDGQVRAVMWSRSSEQRGTK